MFILSALELRGPFHAAKVLLFTLFCNCFPIFLSCATAVSSTAGLPAGVSPAPWPLPQSGGGFPVP